MVDPAKAIRTAYYGALNNTILFNAKMVPFYDKVPSGAAFPYIYISDCNRVEDPTTDKDTFNFDCVATIVVCNLYQANYGGHSDVDTILSEALNLIRGAGTQSTPLPISGFQNVLAYIDGSNYFTTEVADGIIYSSVAKIRHKIQQIQ